MKEFYRRHLPHWQPQSAMFSVTFRLKHSLPNHVIQSLKEERERTNVALHNLPESERAHQKFLDEQLYIEKLEAYLDKAQFGPRWLSNPQIANMVEEALHYRDEKVFDLHAYCIMSNHVHVVFESCRSELHHEQQPLNKIMQSLKRHTARQANKILSREGAFWQDESYDHVIRNHNEYRRAVNYVLENPVRAGLVLQWNEWQWSYCKTAVR